MPAGRSLARTYVSRRFSAERVLVVGSGSVAQVVTRKLRNHPEYAVEIVGCVDESWPEYEGETTDALALRRLGDLSEFERVCREHAVERVVIAFSTIKHERLLELISTSKRLALKVTVVPRLFEAMGHLVEMDQVEGMTLMGLRGLTRTRSTLMLKRGLDLIGATVGLVLLAPVLAAVAVVIKLDSPGPVLYRQRRIGRGNEGFGMYKFRTMVRNAEELKASLWHLNEATAPMFKITDDPRITRVGRFLRRTSLDELPQLFNVLRGEMSLVGPRPLVPLEDDHVIGLHRARLDLTPGLTGPWQVMGRTAIPFQEMMKLDYLYVAEWSLWNDIKLMLRTAPVVFGRRGA
jgi:exopolysaccharide biosynthesis polyprenyl glycosylphosphotransferase